MGFGGAALAANQIMRNNRNLLKQKRGIGKLSFVSTVNEKWVDPKKASFEDLMKIRRKMRKANKVRTRKLVIVTIALLVVLITCASLIPWDMIFTNVH